MEKSTDHTMLYAAVMRLKSEEECKALFDDLFTIKELNAAAQRMKVADMLYGGMTCGSIAEETGASTATVSRVNKCLHYGTGGYQLVLDRMHKKEK